MSLRSTIVTQFEEFAAEHKEKLAPLSDDLKLLDSGLDSLCTKTIPSEPSLRCRPNFA
jgi:hypothetical protein